MVEVTQRVKAEPRSFFVPCNLQATTSQPIGQEFLIILALKSRIFNNEYNSFTQSSVSRGKEAAAYEDLFAMVAGRSVNTSKKKRIANRVWKIHIPIPECPSPPLIKSL